MPKKADKTPPKQRDLPGIPFTKDDPRINREGRPKGTVGFKTIVDRAIKDIAKKNNIKESDAWDILIKRAYSEAKDGDYQFYRDLMDRYFGKPQQHVDLTTQGKELPQPILSNAILNNDGDEENSEAEEEA